MNFIEFQFLFDYTRNSIISLYIWNLWKIIFNRRLLEHCHHVYFLKQIDQRQ